VVAGEGVGGSKTHGRSNKKHTVDGSEIPRPTTWDGAKTLVNNGINYQPQLVIAGFLN